MVICFLMQRARWCYTAKIYGQKNPREQRVLYDLVEVVQI